ncbi:uncharacterized protein METZ01_LOCUS382846, partial [marine metagenome]
MIQSCKIVAIRDGYTGVRGKILMVSREKLSIDSGGIPLDAALFTPQGRSANPGLVICHGMPAGKSVQGQSENEQVDGLTYPEVAEWCAWEGFATMIFNFRGTGDSGGNFHHLGWALDLQAVISVMSKRVEVDGDRIILFGSSLGAAVAIYVAAINQDVAGLVSFASPASMVRRSNPIEALERLRLMGLIREQEFPQSVDDWAKEGEQISPLKWIDRISPRPMFLLHGDSDDVVPLENVYSLYRKAGEPKEMRVLEGVGHRFRSENTA